MTEISIVDRLQARLDRQATRIDALYAALEERGLLPLDGTPSSEPLFDELLQVEDSPLVREHLETRGPRRRELLRVGSATGV